MKLSRGDYHVMRYLRFYRIISVLAMGSSVLHIPFGIYFSNTYARSVAETTLSNALVGASVVVFGMGYLMHCFLNTIERLRNICAGDDA